MIETGFCKEVIKILLETLKATCKEVHVQVHELLLRKVHFSVTLA